VKAVGIVLLVLGILAVVIGLVWIGQGTGYFPYPHSSFMISQMPWAYRGGVLAAIGVAVIILSRRM
jgi:membrane protein implicated in regulation of membrane protease activity